MTALRALSMSKESILHADDLRHLPSTLTSLRLVRRDYREDAPTFDLPACLAGLTGLRALCLDQTGGGYANLPGGLTALTVIWPQCNFNIEWQNLGRLSSLRFLGLLWGQVHTLDFSVLPASLTHLAGRIHNVCQSDRAPEQLEQLAGVNPRMKLTPSHTYKPSEWWGPHTYDPSEWPEWRGPGTYTAEQLLLDRVGYVCVSVV